MTPSAVQEELVARLRASIEAIAAAAHDASEPAAGEWSARDVTLHLIAVEQLVWQQRVADLGSDGAAGEPPRWSWSEPGRWAGRGDETLDGAIGELRRRRDATIDAVRRLADASWERYGVHATFGRLDVAGIVAVALDHDAEHLQQIQRLSRSDHAGTPA